MVVATIFGGRLEDLMANKDKGGRSTKKVAGKSLKEKRLAKQAKRQDHANTGNKSVESTFDH
ncbi:MAG: hypothetical protein WBP49_03355 [Acidimicrobiia bacterium]